MVAGEQTVVHSGKIYIIELKPLCGMQGHQHHSVGIIRKTVDICDKCNLLKEILHKAVDICDKCNLLKEILQSRETSAHLSCMQLRSGLNTAFAFDRFKLFRRLVKLGGLADQLIDVCNPVEGLIGAFVSLTTIFRISATFFPAL